MTTPLRSKAVGVILAIGWAVILTAVWGICTPAHAAGPLSTDFEGRVVVDGKRAAGIPVVLRHPTTGRVLVRYTNSTGRYHFTGLRPDGVYVISANGQSVQRTPVLGRTLNQDF